MRPLPNQPSDVEADAPVSTPTCPQVKVAQPCDSEHMAPTNEEDQEAMVSGNESPTSGTSDSGDPHAPLNKSPAADDEIDPADIEELLRHTNRKKKNNKSLASRGPTALPKNRGTGFEEYYADPPMTPDEASEERQDIYSPERPFIERIEECIQRFRSRRRMNNDITTFFNKYLFLGGIDCSPRQFTGNGNADLKGASSDEKREASAIDMIHQSGGGGMYYSATEPEHWDVDITGVVSGFLSEAVPTLASWNYEQMGHAIGVVDNFLKYILHHDVCPEYEADIKAAIAICSRARIDLPMSHQCLIHFPGEFNLAAAELYCKDTFSFWGHDYGFQRPENFDADRVFKAAIALVGDEGQYEHMSKAISIFVVDEVECDMEVIAVHRPSKEISRLFRGIRGLGLEKSRHAPIGKVILRPCVIENGWDRGDVQAPTPEDEQVFLLDDAILARMQPGFKLQLTVCELNIGVKFIKNGSSVLVPWHTFLPQELMYRYKEPKANDRPAPSVSNPELGEIELAKEVDDD